MPSRIIAQKNEDALQIKLADNFVIPTLPDGTPALNFPYYFEEKNGVFEFMDRSTKVGRFITTGLFQFDLPGAAKTNILDLVYLNNTNQTLYLTSGSGYVPYGYVWEVDPITDNVWVKIQNPFVMGGAGSPSQVDLEDTLTMQVELTSPKDYTILLNANYDFRIDTLTVRSALNTTTGTLKINGVNVGGLTNVSISTTPATYTATSTNTGTIGQSISLTVGNTSVTDLVFSVKIYRIL